MSPYTASLEERNLILYSSYTETNLTISGQQLLLRTLNGNRKIQKVYFRLPDGGVNGDGFSSTGSQSITQLYTGAISSIANTYGTATYTSSSLRSAIAAIISARNPSSLTNLDYLSDYGQCIRSQTFIIVLPESV